MNRHEKWLNWYNNEKKQPYFKDIYNRALKLNEEVLLSPEPQYWFRALDFDDISKIHTVIIASRPFNDAYAADGYAFSCIDEADREMGLLYRKLYNELGVVYDQYDNSKQRWAEQGVLLLCMELTTQCGKFKDDTRLWTPFTQRVLRYFIEDDQLRAFVFLDRYSSHIPALFADKPEREHLYLNYDIRTPEFQRAAIFTPVNNFIMSNYSRNIDWH